VRNLTILYGTRTALEDVDIDVHEIEILVIIGPATAG
jgi:ABC-type branched-subunit amino acid transport system ATPase component